MKTRNFIYIILMIASYFNISAQESFTEGEYPTEEISILLPGEVEPQTVTVEVVDGQYIYQSDIIVTPYTPSSGDQGRGGATMITNTVNQRYKWPNSTIPYDLPNDIAIKSTIEWAIEQINNRTNLCMVPKTSSHTSWIKFNCLMGRGGGSSALGRQGGEQLVNIGETAARGTSIHEIMHAAGFYHEQCRLDRDSSITVNFSNIRSGKAHNFYKLDRKQGGRDLGSYDYGSLMHYSSRAFGKPDPANPSRRLVTITTRNGEAIGQRNDFSPGDIASINAVYSACGSGESASSGSEGSSPSLLESIWGIVWPFDSDEGEGDASGPNTSFDIQYNVELVPQLTGMSCWAAGAAMLVGWHDRVSIDPSEIANRIGYWAQYDSQGLTASDMTMLNHWHLQAESPQTFTVRAFVELLGTHGPLWVATNEGNPHIRVVAGAAGDGTAEGTVLTIYDPWQRGMRRFRSTNTGSIYTETYAEWERKNRELAGSESDEPAPIYVAHN